MLIELLARTSKLDLQKLIRLSETANQRYKLYEIPKRSGGTRKIEHPSRELKAIQRWIVRALILRFPVHEAATAYRSGVGIRENAERHRRSHYTNRYDFANFFPSFHQGHIESFIAYEALRFGILLNEQDIRFVGRIVCRRGRLTIGAPSSPAITNAMMFEFDCRMFNYCTENELIYTRYADDLFVSSMKENNLTEIHKAIIESKKGIDFLNLRLNHKKTVHLSRKYHRGVTGVVITPDHKLSIGRDRKREIKSLIHMWRSGRLPSEKVHYMRGLLSYARDIEPDFEQRMRRKYGDNTIHEILRNPDLKNMPDSHYTSLRIR